MQTIPEKTSRLGVLVSGSGTNLQAIIDGCREGIIGAEVAVVISDVEKAFALERARKAGIRDVYIPWKKGKKSEWEEEAVGHLRDAKVDLICLAGFMRIVGPTFMSAFKNRIINIHPAILPSFTGLHAQEQAFDWGVKVSGCTVHFVTDDLDMGPIIVQKVVEVKEDDTAETLSARILEQEHKAYPEAINLVLEGRTEMIGRKVRIK